MEEDKNKLVALFERKIKLLLENNEGYSRFKGRNPLKLTKELLSKENAVREDIIDLGFLLHLYALQLRLAMYKNLTPFTMLNFKKDLQEIINALHAYQRHRNLQTKLRLGFPEATEIKALIPPFLDEYERTISSTDNPELYNEILNMLEEDDGRIEVDIPKDIIKEMQYIDLKKIYNELPTAIGKNKYCTVRELAHDFPVFENDKLSLAVVFN